MTVEVRRATNDDAAQIALLNVDVQRIHADAHPWLFKQPGPETFTPPDAAALLAKPNPYRHRPLPAVAAGCTLGIQTKTNIHIREQRPWRTFPFIRRSMAG
jgi:hypothetical protein